MRHPICKNSGRAHVVGMVTDGVVKYFVPKDQPTITCAKCGKKLRRQTMVGKLLAYNITQLYEYVRQHVDDRRMDIEVGAPSAGVEGVEGASGTGTGTGKEN